MDNHFDVVIIGGGASGLMCALTAGRRGGGMC
ncbi:MAG: NAD(P)/FAD-dependent oxidoreductase [Desulfobacterales bacterium]|nr:NAD(P)/FAD-dependent oxidoreductase [Desulfobacterales bacterium]MDD3950596.1 NAD(P)/FAD-dependent oxidoreductase [Desulfobacterales bacterium]